MMKLIGTIEDELRANSDPKHAKQLIRFFKNQTVHPLGVRSKEMNTLVAKHWREIKLWDKSQIWSLCDALWQTGILENGHLACKFAFRVGRRLEADDFTLFSHWLNTYIYNWAHCDDLCTKALGETLYRFPALLEGTCHWHNSPNRWVRRGLAVSLINPLKKGHHLDHSLKVADKLLHDDDDLVRKGYGWMLKVASQTFPDEIFGFVMDRRDTMPRVTLRYAIEKLPQDKRKAAMSTH